MYADVLDIKDSYINGGNKRLIKFYSNKYHIQAAILDIILRYGEVDYHQLETSVFGEYATVESMNAPYSYFQIYLGELYATGVIKAHIKGVADEMVTDYIEKEYKGISDVLDKAKKNSEIKDKTSISLTEVGLELIRNQTYHSNALTALTARQSQKLSRLTIFLSIIAIVISIIAICVTN